MMLLRKLGLVMWKNLLLRKRHWIVTTFEIVIPVALFILAAVIRSQITLSYVTNVPAKYFPVENEEDVTSYIFCDTPLLYAPNNTFTRYIMDNVTVKDNVFGGAQAFDTEDELLSHYFAMNKTLHRSCAVVFEDVPPDGDVDHLKYKIRISNRRFQTAQLFPEYGLANDLYLSSSFLGLQLLIDKAFMEQQGVNGSEFQFSVQAFPYLEPDENQDVFTQIFSALLPVFTVLSFVMLCPSTMKRIVEEKGTGVKELMKMMGLKTWMLWISWMVNALLVNVVTVTIIVVLLKVPFGDIAVLQYSDYFLVWVILLFYCVAGVTFCFAIGSFFSKQTVPISENVCGVSGLQTGAALHMFMYIVSLWVALFLPCSKVYILPQATLAMSIGMVLWILSYSATTYPVINGTSVEPGVKLLSAILPNTAINWAFNLIISWETTGEGLSWRNFFIPPSGKEGDISVGLVWVMLIVDIVIYSIVTWYIDSVMPGKYGLAKPWYFFVMPSYWCSRKFSDTSYFNKQEKTNTKFENPPSNLHVGIKIQSLYKIFHSLGGFNKKVAVDGITLDIYSGEITALLGHNGAGKTTTMSILTGMYSATSGSVHINGYDIHENLDKVRESLGLCPQHNLLFSDLTVMEHLLFFAMLKGCSRKEAEKDAVEFLQRLNLINKKNQMSSTLSGGMKRKLSLGIALIGNSKVLMLDEPTSGLDPEARREIWDLLLSMRGQRTILITTHFMEEADVLGDRIAIMYHGQVQCYGSSLFLKKQYGTGYQLNLLKERDCNVARITNIIQQTVPEAEIKSELGTVLCYMLPSEQTKQFPDLFEILERDKQSLGISSIGVSITTLEEVFLRVGKEAEGEHDNGTNMESSNNGFMSLHGNAEALTFSKVVGTRLMIQQIAALLKKRVIYTCREWRAFLIRALIAIVLAVLTVALVNTADDQSTAEPARNLSLKDYSPTEVLYTSSNELNELLDSYIDLAENEGSSVKNPGKPINHALVELAENISDYHTKYIVAAEFNYSDPVSVSLNAMYSPTAFHAAPISLNLLTNAVLNNHTDKKSSITVINHPLETKQELGPNPLDALPDIGVMSLWMTLMPYSLLILTGGFISFPVLERVSKAKQLQLMTGTSPIAYWFTCFVCDSLYYIIVASIMVLGILAADPLNAFNGSEELGVYFLMVLMYGLCSIPFAYIFSYFRRSSSGAFSLLAVTSILTGMIMSLVVYIMLQASDFKSAGNGLKYVLQFIPHFSITFGLMRFSDQVMRNNRCKIKTISCPGNDVCCQPECKDGNCPPIYKSYLELADDSNPNAVGEQILYMAVDSILYFGLIMLADYGVFEKLYDMMMKTAIGIEIDVQQLEDDVLTEKERVNSKIGAATLQQSSDDIMLVHNLVKKFKVNFAAVKGVSFGVSPGECFGLLGVNGAGKTTTFRMLTGDEIPSSGDALIKQHRLEKEKHKFLAQIGYCPQFDGIIDTLTGHEMLELFASLRGVSKCNIDNEVNKWISLMGLKEYENRQCGTYSGGNKRKLSTAMALIGNPPIVFLDEPTSGVDPVARRNLWTVLTSIQKSGQSVVLTSHSMEECEALCNRLAIMVGGQFMCMGGIQYLKQKYGQGFTVMVKLRVGGTSEEKVKSLKNEIENSFNTGCILKDEHQGLLHYHVTNPNTPWKYLFLTMERMKQNFELVEDYTISETTLEQVFLSFAKAQPANP